MMHLWIDFELIRDFPELRPPWSFRFQKRVSGYSAQKLIGLPCPARKNVGHYSVRPDFRALLKIPRNSVAGYALSLIYASTAVLIEKQKKLGGFDACKFRSDFLAACRRHGYKISLPDGSR